jgi:tight adherence protein B
MPTPYRIALGLLAAGAVWLIAQLAVSILTRRTAPVTVLAEAQREEQERALRRPSLKARITNAAAQAGWTGMLAPLAVFTGLLWGIISLAGIVLTQRALWSMIAAVPMSVGAVWLIGSVVASKRKARFDQQLLNVLTLTSASIEAGSSLLKSLGAATAASEEPLRTEMQAALDEAAVTGDLPEALTELSHQYPSRAFDMFLLALAINRADTARVGPALRQAADSLRKDFELAQEATAEIATAKTEFVGILGIMAFIAFSMLAGGDATTHAAYFTPIGFVLLAVGVANMMFGIFRAQNTFRVAGGQRPRPLPSIPKKVRGRGKDAEEVQS